MSQTFQVIRTVKRRQRKLLEVAEGEEQTPSGKPGKQRGPKKLKKEAKASKKTKKQITSVEETSQQVVYGFTNLTPTEAGPEIIATFLRDHWAVENRLHWRRDVTLREDHSQVRIAGRPEGLAALNTVVLALMDWLGARNVPEHMRIFRAFPNLALDLLLGPMTFE